MQNYNELHDIAAESAVIASIIYHPDFILHSDFLKANMFSQVENASCYWAVGELYRKGIDNIDEININNQLQSNAAVKKAMAKRGLTDIKDFIDNSQYAARDTIPEYLEACKTVCAYAYKREMYKYAEELKRESLSDDKTIVEIDRDTHEKFNALTERFLVSEEIQTLGEANKDVLTELEERQGNDAVAEIPSIISEFSPYFSYEKGELVVFLAKAKTGKSMLLTSECLGAAKHGITVLYVDTEIDDKHFYWRLLSNVSGVPYQDVKSNHWTPEQASAIKKADEYLKTLHIYHQYMPVVNIDQVYSLCKILQWKDNLGLLCFDYCKSVGETDMGTLSNKLATQINSLKNLIAGSLSLPVAAAAQLGKDMTNAFGSSQVGMYASTSVVLLRKTPEEIREDGGYEYGRLKAQVTLNRNGAMMDEDQWISVGFDGSRCRIFDCKQPEKHTPFGEEE